jgi:DNA-binding transcriptional regulator YiaG
VERESRKSPQRKFQGKLVYEGFGFPVALINVPMARARGAWTPDVNFNALSGALLEALARKPARLTGREVRFIRHSLSMTLEKFARRFGVTHPAVIKWERSGNRPTVMAWAVEKDIRLEALRSASRVASSGFLKAYRDLETQPAAKSGRVQLDVMKAM